MDNIKIVIKRDDEINGFACYHARDKNDTKTVLMNVEATFIAGITENMDIKRIMVENLMHEFGHALEEFYKLEFNEDFIEKAVQSYYDMAEKQSA